MLVLGPRKGGHCAQHGVGQGFVALLGKMQCGLKQSSTTSLDRRSCVLKRLVGHCRKLTGMHEGQDNMRCLASTFNVLLLRQELPGVHRMMWPCFVVLPGPSC